MDTAEIDFIDQGELDKVFDIVIEVTLTPLPGLRATAIERLLEKLAHTLISYSIPGFVIMALLTALTMATHSHPLASTTLTIGILLKVVAVGITSIGVLSGIIFLRKVKRSPYAPFLKHVANSFTFDLRYVNRLSLCDLNAVRYVLSYYKFERLTFERRVCMLGGSIGRVGFFPALGALAVLGASLAKVPGVGDWALSLVGVILAFYFFHFAAGGMLQKKDRVIAMLEFVVQSHGAQKAAA
jgi:hypothetical protein